MSTTEQISEHFIVPENVQKLASMANSDLWSGPTYLDEDGEPVSMFDPDYVRAFDFPGACQTITEWCDANINPVYMETWSGYLVNELPEYEEDEDGCIINDPQDYREYADSDVKEALFGRELAKHL